MRPELSFVRYGNIIATIWYKERLKLEKGYRFMIFCHGLPGHPYQHNPSKVEALLEKGYVLIYPHYIGTWASYGKMSWENCIATISQTIDFLKGGKTKELYGGTDISWKLKEIILVGGSFGGSVALVAGAKSRDVKKIISVSAPTDYRTHSKIEGEEAEPIEDLYHVVMRGWGNLWRIPSREEWEKLASGKAINPVDHIGQLRKKDVLSIHGTGDKVVSHVRSKELYENLKSGEGNHQLLLVDDDIHLGNDCLCREDIFPKLLDWLG